VCLLLLLRFLLLTSPFNKQESERLKQEEESKILGEYRISVTLHGGFAYHLKQSQAVVASIYPVLTGQTTQESSPCACVRACAVYDFREASTQPLFISSTSVAGDMGQTWLVGSVLVGRNIFRWSQTYVLSALLR